MKARTKLQQVPTVLLDNVLAIKLKQQKKKAKPIKYSQSKKVVIYKMISTDEWKKKEEARIAKEAQIKAKREAPKSDASIYSLSCSLGLNKHSPKSREQKRKEYNEYYFHNKQKMLRYQAKRRQRIKDQLIVSKPKVPPTDAK